MNDSRLFTVSRMRIALVFVAMLVIAIAPLSTASAQGPVLGFRPICTVLADRLNLRSGPDADVYPIVGKLVPGTLVNITGRLVDNSWVQIEVRENADTGWVKNTPDFIACLGLINAQPVLDAPPAPAPKPVIDAPAPAPVQAPAARATPAAPAVAPAPEGIPAPIALEYDGSGFVWDWGGMALMPDENWYFDVKIYADGGQDFPYAVKIPDFGALNRNGPNNWRYIKSTDFVCGSEWSIQIAQRNPDGSFAGFASPESQRLPTGQGCSNSSGGGGGGGGGGNDNPSNPGATPPPGECSYC